MSSSLSLSEEVVVALAEGRPVVALESTIISHGFPYPANLECALNCERVVREEGAVPATIAVLGGRPVVGLSAEQIEHLATAGPDRVAKASRRDLGVLAARKADGATTVAGTMLIAALAGIRVFATGGIGGVHRGAQESFDVSADLMELARTPVCVVCAGAKSVLDIGLTLEVLETHGVPVLGYATDEFPAFYSRSSGYEVDARFDSPAEIAEVLDAADGFELDGGIVVANPIAPEHEIDRDEARRLDRHGACGGRRGGRARQGGHPVPARAPARALGGCRPKRPTSSWCGATRGWRRASPRRSRTAGAGERSVGVAGHDRR